MSRKCHGSYVAATIVHQVIPTRGNHNDSFYKWLASCQSQGTDVIQHRPGFPEITEFQGLIDHVQLCFVEIIQEISDLICMRDHTLIISG